jgi:hypothetical protein
MRARWAEWDAMFRLRNRRQIEVRPAVLFQQVADQIVHNA